MASCRSCDRYDANYRDNWGDGYCSYYGRHVDGGSSACSHYRCDENSGCFLTTMTCLILGEPDDGPTLTTLRAFRENVLRKEVRFAPILEEYDVLGLRISERLWSDPDRERVAGSLMAEHLTPVLEAVRAGQTETAVERYRAMVRMLQQRYAL